jgi:hypothetical protein
MAEQLRFFGAAPISIVRKEARLQEQTENPQLGTACGESHVKALKGPSALVEADVRTSVVQAAAVSIGCPDDLLSFESAFEAHPEPEASLKEETQEARDKRLQELMDVCAEEFEQVAEEPANNEAPNNDYTASARFHEEGVKKKKARSNKPKTKGRRAYLLELHEGGDTWLPYKD